MISGDKKELKIIDFGLAKQSKKTTSSMHTVAGTPYYMAPEVIKGHYGFECDMWSLGVIMFIMLCGHFPFNGNSRGEVFSKIKAGEINWHNATHISDEARDLIMKLLTVERKKRITADKAISHGWFQKVFDKKEENGEEEKLDAGVLKQLREYKGTSKLKKAAMNVLVKMLNPKEIEHLRGEFQKIDTDNSGMIEPKELEEAVRNANFNMPAEELK